MDKFTRNLITEWRKLNLPFEGETILIAVSGGADSVSLTAALGELRAAKKLNLNFVVAHFNHQLRGADANADEAFVENLAKILDFKFVAKTWHHSNPQNQKSNLEQSARKARYDFLQKTAENENAFVVLTAHTLNDQAETLLLNLIRGSGFEGLGAMRTSREMSVSRAKRKAQSAKSDKTSILLVRPLLRWARREDTESFALRKEIAFRQDSMNSDEKFSRVKVRKKLIPLLREFNPKIVETLAQTAFLMQKEADSIPVSNFNSTSVLAIKELQNLSNPEVYLNLRQWLEMVRGDLRQIDLKHIKAIEQLIFSRKSGKKVELPDGGNVIKKDGKIFFEKLKVEKSRSGN